MRIVVLTGAGVSAESGLGTFRDKGGLWAKYDPMKLATPEAFADDPTLVHAFYNARRANLLGAEPNAAHHALTRLQTGLAASGGRLSIVTQNVDDLHERAGSQDVLHMHGELLKARCLKCQAVSDWRADLGTATAARPAARRAGYGPMSSGSARCRSICRRSRLCCRRRICSWRSGRPARSIRRPASCMMRGCMACGRAR